jgi:hypothetical protein
MSRAINLPTGASRVTDVGLVWREISTGSAGTWEVPKFCAVRVRATATTSITIDSVLSATMTSGEILIFNSGRGTNLDFKDTVTLASSGTAYVQVGIEVDIN